MEKLYLNKKGLQTSPVTYRPGTVADSYAVFTVFEHSLADLAKRMGNSAPTSSSDPEALTRMWAERRSLYEHLANSAAQFWIAEKDGEVIGFSRSILRGDCQQLTEFFVLPENQAAGVGKELFALAFPEIGVSHRSIIATLDSRAQARYLKAGVYPRFPIYYFWRTPEILPEDPDLEFRPITAELETLAVLGTIDLALIEHKRDTDHSWLLADRQGYLYLRDGKPVGYGYLGSRNGPFALLDAADFPSVLAHAEAQSAQAGHTHFGLEVPMINQAAVDYLLNRGFRMDSFVAVLMNNRPFGKFERYIFTSPPFFM